MAITKNRELDPISRIEGHLGASLEVSGTIVKDVELHGNLWRGFENFLIGREPNDAITFTQRICGVCPVPHGMTATYAVEAALGYNDGFQTPSASGNPGNGVPEKAVHIRNAVLGAEFLMSSLTHFYHLAAPSYIQGPAMPPWTPYFHDNYYAAAMQSTGKGAMSGSVATLDDGTYRYAGRGFLPIDATNGFSKDLWSAIIKQYVKALRIRRLALEAGALFAGRMPMTSCYVAGGVTTNKDESLTTKCTKFSELMKEIGDFVVQEYIPITLALGYFYQDFDNFGNGTGKGWGAGCGNFLSWGGFPEVGVPMDTAGQTGNHFGRGYKIGAGAVQTIVANDVYNATSGSSKLAEHLTYSRYDYTSTSAVGFGYTSGGISYPAKVTRTVPMRSNGYSYLKAPRWNDGTTDQPMEVGPLARMAVDNWYPVDGATTLISGSTNLGSYYALFTKDLNGTVGLDPVMIEPDLAVALVRTKAAKLLCSGSAVTVVDDAVLATLTKDQIVGAYYNTAASGLGAAVIVDGADHLMVSWIAGLKGGLSTMDRIRARSLESLRLMVYMMGAPSKTTTGISWPNTGWNSGLSNATGGTYTHVAMPAGKVFGFGATEAPRGALMHMCTIENGKISAYQCIVPTTWNGSPRDAAGTKGPIEQAIAPSYTPSGSTNQRSYTGYAADGGVLYNQAGVLQSPTEGGVEALRIAQSFDPCIACAVH